jgi:hypothetical protein
LRLDLLNDNVYLALCIVSRLPTDSAKDPI